MSTCTTEHIVKALLSCGWQTMYVESMLLLCTIQLSMSLIILKSSWFNLIHRRLRSQMCEMACKLFFQVKKPSSLEQGLVLLPAVSTGIQWLMESGASLTYQHVRWTYKLGQDHAKPANSNNCSHFLTEFKWITMNQAYSPKALRMHHAPTRMTATYLVIAVVVLAISGHADPTRFSKMNHV